MNNNVILLKNNLLKKLDFFNDEHFKFIPETHRYFYKHYELISITKFIKRFCNEFDKEYWSEKKSNDSGFPKEWILNQWEDKNNKANSIGKAVHQWIENYFNGVWQKLPNDVDVVDKINKFNILYAKHLYKLEPVKFEIKIFSKKWKIAGTIDSLFIHKDKIYIIDWKTNFDFTHDNHPKGKYRKLLNPFDNYYENNLNVYSIQQSMYSLILEECGINVDGMFLIHIGPYNDEFKIYKAHDLKIIIKSYLNKDMDMLYL